LTISASRLNKATRSCPSTLTTNTPLHVVSALVPPLPWPSLGFHLVSFIHHPWFLCHSAPGEYQSFIARHFCADVYRWLHPSGSKDEFSVHLWARLPLHRAILPHFTRIRGQLPFPDADPCHLHGAGTLSACYLHLARTRSCSIIFPKRSTHDAHNHVTHLALLYHARVKSLNERELGCRPRARFNVAYLRVRNGKGRQGRCRER
jgi:hypothetical protein